jgi:hypothetical protein
MMGLGQTIKWMGCPKMAIRRYKVKKKYLGGASSLKNILEVVRVSKNILGMVKVSKQLLGNFKVLKNSSGW